MKEKKNQTSWYIFIFWSRMFDLIWTIQCKIWPSCPEENMIRCKYIFLESNLYNLLHIKPARLHPLAINSWQHQVGIKLLYGWLQSSEIALNLFGICWKTYLLVCVVLRCQNTSHSSAMPEQDITTMVNQTF